MNYYEILEVSENASESTIKAAYRAQVKKFHPDVYKADKDEANVKMSEINMAYDTLSNPEKRKRYDELLHSCYRKTETESEKTEKDIAAYAETHTQSAEKQKSDFSGCSGCLKTIFGLILWIVVISLVLKMCTGKDAIINTPVLSEKAQKIEKMYFHKPYTDLGTVEIHEFPEREKVLEYMEKLATDKEFLEDGCYIAYEEKLIGKDYYYSTLAQTDYYYVGKMKNNRPHGFGAILGLSNGEGTYDLSGEALFYYVGNFRNGVKNGFGVEFSADESDITFAVQHIQNLNVVSEENGELLCQYLFNHVKYEGYWKNNKYDGKGNKFDFALFYTGADLREPIEGYIYANAYPDVTKGEWKNGKLTGKVSIYESNKVAYIGEMKKDRRHGKGISYYPNGQVEYDGKWKNGRAHGRGSYYNYKGELMYKGQWKNGEYAH